MNEKQWHDFRPILPPPWLRLLIFLTCWPAALLADELIRDKDSDGLPMALRITDKPCTNAEVLGHLSERLLDERRFKRSVLTWKGEDWESYYAVKDDQVYSIDSSGQPLNPPLPKSRFLDESI